MTIYNSLRPKLSDFLQNGPRTIYWRDAVRPKILNAIPRSVDPGAEIEVHMLTSSADCLNAIWSLHSLLNVCERKLAVTIHDDGTMSTDQHNAIGRLIPGSNIITRSQADTEVDTALSNYPACREFRRTNPLAAKLFDFQFYLSKPHMLLLDSDVLFFSAPTALFEAAKAHPAKNHFNAGQRSMYTIPVSTLSQLTGLDIPVKVNSGLGMVSRESLRLDWIEEFLHLPGILSHSWRVEQTLYTLCSARFGAALLPSNYDVTLDRLARKGVPCRHYVGPIRNLFYHEGIRRLHRDILKSL